MDATLVRWMDATLVRWMDATLVRWMDATLVRSTDATLVEVDGRDARQVDGRDARQVDGRDARQVDGRDARQVDGRDARRLHEIVLPRVVTSAQARAAGHTPSAVRHAVARGRWRPLGRGVLLTVGGEPARLDRACGALLAAGPTSALSGWDAVVLLDARVVGQAPAPDEVVVLSEEGDDRLFHGVRIRPTVRPFETSIVRSPRNGSLRIVDPPRAVADAALQLRDVRPVAAIVANAVQRGLCSPTDLRKELESCPRNGSHGLRVALESIADGARSIAEADAVRELRQCAVPPFELNVPILGRDGTVVAVADIFWRALAAVLEVDSREYHFSEADWNRTMARHNALTAGGLAVTHYSPARIRRGDLRATVEPWLRGRAAALGLSYRVRPRVVRPGTGESPSPFVLPARP